MSADRRSFLRLATLAPVALPFAVKAAAERQFESECVLSRLEPAVFGQAFSGGGRGLGLMDVLAEEGVIFSPEHTTRLFRQVAEALGETGLDSHGDSIEAQMRDHDLFDLDEASA